MRNKPQDKYCCDFETTSEEQYMIEGRTKVYLWAYNNLYGENNNFHFGLTIENFIEDIFKNCKNNSILYFHNGSGFDFEFILWYLLENDFKYVEKPTSEKSFTTITTFYGKHYMLSIHYKRKTLIFYDSFLLIPVSIDDLGKVVGIKKLYETHNYSEIKNYKSLDEVTEEELSYIKNDVKIMQEGIKYFNKEGINKMTLASSCYANWRKDSGIYLFEKERLKKPKDDFCNEKINESYRGAITMVNKKFAGKVINEAISYDFNSMYPSKMLYYTFPCGEPKKFDTLEEAKKYGKKILISVYITKAKIVKDFIPFIPKKSSVSINQSYQYEDIIENKSYTLWIEEFSLFEKFYEGVWDVLSYISFKACKDIFKNYIEHWRNVKENPRNEEERFLAKRMLNSLYGKFGMNENQTKKIVKGIVNDKIVYEMVDEDLKYKYRAIASYITMLARIELISAIENNFERFIYCDTDSIYLKGYDLADIPTDCKKFNYWKLEGFYDKSKFLKSKCYMKHFEDSDKNGKDKNKLDIKIAGLPKECKNDVTFDNFKNGLCIKGKKKAKMRVRGGVIIASTDFTLYANEYDINED